MYGDWLYFMTPDCWLISLNAKDGKERWKKKIADEKMQYFCTTSTLVVKNHVLVGVGGDAMDVPGYLDAHDPETGELQWRRNTTLRKGEPGRDMAQSASYGARRRNDLDAWYLRSGVEPYLLGNGQSESCLCRPGAQGR